MDTDVQTYVTSHSHEQGYAGRIEVVTGPTGRRRWPERVKAAMVLETFRAGVSVSDVARKRGGEPATAIRPREQANAPQLHAWRRAAREGLLPMPEDEALGLVPIVVAGGGPAGGAVSPESALVLEIGSVKIAVPPGFDPDHLGRVITALRSLS